MPGYMNNPGASDTAFAGGQSDFVRLPARPPEETDCPHARTLLPPPRATVWPPMSVTPACVVRLFIGLCLAQSLPADAAPSAIRPPNVLFIVADDLRNELGCYGAPVRSPNLDALAARGVRFDRAYVQYPLCNPSRTSLLTGQYPEASGVLNNRQWWGRTHPQWRTLPGYFRDHGYTTLRAGKIFHKGIDDPSAWTHGGEPRVFADDASEDVDPTINAQRGTPEATWRASNARSDRVVEVEGDGEELTDYQTAAQTIDFLRAQRGADKPFFLACGFVLPHTPLIAPRRFFELYDLAAIELPGDFSSQPTGPAGFPALAVPPHNTDLFIGRDASVAEAKRVVRGYRAATSFMDAQVGRVLRALEENGFAENTIVVFWGDHGYHLGEKGRWSKAYSLFEVAARAPLLIAAPSGLPRGRTVVQVAEVLGLYRTLTELCGLPPPPVRGESLLPLMQDPALPDTRSAYTISAYDGHLGRTVRVARWRYTEWDDGRGGAVLFDAVNDPHERTNLAGDPAHAVTVEELKTLLAARRRDAARSD